MFPGAVSNPSPFIDCSASAPAGPLNVRQKFLLGRKVDINRAGWEEISGLPGISDKVAESIVESRGRVGGFRRPEDLLMAKGIKGKKLKKILPFISGFDNN
jgi:competence ComEA-like helix-hairpin-helix protein